MDFSRAPAISRSSPGTAASFRRVTFWILRQRQSRGYFVHGSTHALAYLMRGRFRANLNTEANGAQGRGVIIKQKHMLIAKCGNRIFP